MPSATLRMIFLVLLALATPAATLGAAAQTPADQPADAHAVIERMDARNPSLRSFRTRVHVGIRMLSFPWFAPELDGTSYYQRPDYYEVVFDRVPSYARGFQRIFDDIGNPHAWEKDHFVTLEGTAMLGGRSAIVLRMTKKIHSDILDHTLAYVDPSNYALLQMEWYYTSGGKITMTQQYRMQGGYAVLAQQHADIDIPHVRAVADSSYGTYETNVPIATGSAQP